MRHRHLIMLLGIAAAFPFAACVPPAMGPVTIFADPGKYEYFSCELLSTSRKTWAERELELKLLMDRAEQSSGGAFVNMIAYQSDYVAAREELKVIDETRRAKRCDGLRWCLLSELDGDGGQAACGGTTGTKLGVRTAERRIPKVEK